MWPSDPSGKSRPSWASMGTRWSIIVVADESESQNLEVD